MVIFLFLDESLGEYGTQWWIGDITWGEEQLKDSFPLQELDEMPECIPRTRLEKNTRQANAGRSSALNPMKDATPRSDLITLTTIAPSLHHQYLDAEGDLADPLAGTGADYLYMPWRGTFSPEAVRTEKRGGWKTSSNKPFWREAVAKSSVEDRAWSLVRGSP